MYQQTYDSGTTTHLFNREKSPRKLDSQQIANNNRIGCSEQFSVKGRYNTTLLGTTCVGTTIVVPPIERRLMARQSGEDSVQQCVQYRAVPLVD
eukprot:6483313-Amphidinium_carterae.2